MYLIYEDGDLYNKAFTLHTYTIQKQGRENNLNNA